MSITYFECVCSFRYQHAKRMRRVILSSVTSPALQHVSILSHTQHDLGGEKKGIEHNMCFYFSLILLSTPFIILRRSERDIVKNVYWSCKVPLIIVRS